MKTLAATFRSLLQTRLGRARSVATIGIVCALAACGGNASSFDAVESSSGNDVPSDAQWEHAIGEHAKRVTRVREGTVLRSSLNRVLDSGLGRFLQRVTLEPVRHGSDFVGFRVTSARAGDPIFEVVDLRVGDIVTRVNGLPIGHPDEAVRAWDKSREVQQLTVDVLRDSTPHRLTFAVQ